MYTATEKTKPPFLSLPESKPNSHVNHFNSKLQPPFYLCSSLTAKYLSAGINNIPTNNSPCLHLVKYALQLAETNSLEGRVNEAPREEVDRLLGVGAVADVAALDGDHADDALEDGGGDAGAGGQADADDAAAGADVVGGLLEGLLGHGEEDGGVGAQAVGGGGLDVGDEVLGGEEVDVGSGAQLLGGLALLLTTVDGDRVDAHGLAVLQGHVAETTTGSGNGDPLAGADARLLDSLVDGDTGAEHGSDGLETQLLGDAGHVGGLGDGVLLEGAVDGVTGELGLGAEGLVGGHTV